MAKVLKSFKLAPSVISCIEEIKSDVENNEQKITQTDIVEKAILNYYVSVYGEKALTDILTKKGVL